MVRFAPRRRQAGAALAVVTLIAVTLGCGGFGLGDPAAGVEEEPERPLAPTYGSAALDRHVEEAVREQEAREALLDALARGDVPSRTADVDAAWRAVFGDP